MNKESLLSEFRHESRENLLGQIEGVAGCLLLAMEAKANQFTVKLITGELMRLILNCCGWQMHDVLERMHPLDLVRLVYLFTGRDAETQVKRIEAEYNSVTMNGTEQRTSVP